MEPVRRLQEKLLFPGQLFLWHIFMEKHEKHTKRINKNIY